MAADKNASSSFSIFSRNEFLEESGYQIPHTTNLYIEEPSSGGVRELSEESTENQEKAPTVIMENSTVDMENIVLEIPAGNDVVEAIINFAKRHEASIDVTNGSGLVSDIILLEPDSRVPAFQLDGPFNVLSITGVYLNPDCFAIPPQLIHDPLCTAFALQLSGSRGQVFGGVVGGKINAASDIQISAFLFKKPQFLRVVTTEGNVQLFEDDDVPTITGDGDGDVDVDVDVEADADGVDANETHLKSDDEILP